VEEQNQRPTTGRKLNFFAAACAMQNNVSAYSQEGLIALLLNSTELR
jgi:hypothetical protein